LLVALIPGLLMLATIGLGRLESRLTRDAVSVADVDEFLQQARAADRPAPRPVERVVPIGIRTGGPDATRLPTRVYVPQLANPQFQAPRHADRV
jgi:hypothetical protein